jgi:hypothetical protein
MSLKIDPEFASMLGELSQEEEKTLSLSIQLHGVREPISVWENDGEEIIIDGHNRYRIAKALGKLCRKNTLHFVNRKSARLWIAENQIGRRNLTQEKKAYCLGLLYNAEKKEVGNPLFRHDVGIGSTAKKLAEAHGVTPRTVERAGQYAAAVDTVEDAFPGTKAKALAGDAPRDRVVEAAKKVKSGNIDEAKTTLEKAKSIRDELKKEFDEKKQKDICNLSARERGKMLLNALPLAEAIVLLINLVPDKKERLIEVTRTIKKLAEMSREMQRENR